MHRIEAVFHNSDSAILAGNAQVFIGPIDQNSLIGMLPNAIQ
jgi:hypothetical protein